MKNKTRNIWLGIATFTSVPALLATLIGAALLAGGTQTATAQGVLFTEPFSANASNWSISNSTTFVVAPWVSTGGPNGVGDGYISRTVQTNGGVLFRGQDNFNSSGDGFVGNWIAMGVSIFDIDVLQDSGIDQTFVLRFASSGNFPGASSVAFTVTSGVWTGISIPIVDSVSSFQAYEGSDFNTIFSSIGNVQLSISAPPGSPFNLSIDNPTISVPEPSTFAMAGLGLVVFGLIGRNRKK